MSDNELSARSIISGVREIGGSRLLQMTAPISPGSSGGPVLDGGGHVIGVSVGAIREGQNLNFAIPVEYVSSLLLVERQSLRPLSTMRTRVASKEKNTRGSVGAPTSAGVQAIAFEWDSYGYGGYSFSVRNELQQPVTRVSCLIVFYDSDGRPIDFQKDELRYDTIPPGLARRHKTFNSMNSTYNVSKHVEIRVLDFTIVH